jgi:hypothetical protein
MVCPNCGTDRKADANYCWNCGYNFTKDTLEDFRDEYQVNISGSIIIGLCSGIITGIVSAGLTNSISLPQWGWGVTFGITFVISLILIWKTFSNMKKSAIRQLRRRQ